MSDSLIHHEPHPVQLGARLNWLRAAVLGANDGIVSTAGIVVGVAAATTAREPIITAGIAGLVAGAVSMALGEYVSVSAQRDSEEALLAKERRELIEMPEEELAELTAIYEAKGLSPATAQQVALELTENDAFSAHAEAELKIDPDDLTNPWHAAASSAIAFTVGALLPLIAIVAATASTRIWVTFVTVVAALSLTGYVGAVLGAAPRTRATLRVAIGGLIAMIVTYLIGRLVGTVIS